MKIAIYQINMDRDNDRVAFESLDRLAMYQGSPEINSSIYDKVYNGDVDCNNLEDVYRMFNLEHPAEYKGRSLSVSDIVEVQDSPKLVGEIVTGNSKEQFTDLLDYNSRQEELRMLDRDFVANDYIGLNKRLIEPGFYFCDSVGFKEVVFEAEHAAQVKQETMRVVLLEPGKLAREAEIGTSLADMQRAVGGDIEPFYPFEEEVCIVCNEEGKLNGMALNRAVRWPDTDVDMAYGELVSRFRQAERSGQHLTGYVVISQDSFTVPYPVEARTYVVSSENKAFQPNMGGYSIYASSLDGSDRMVRLEGYLAAEKGGKDGWKIERCYMKERGPIMDIIAGPCFICDCSGESFGSLSDEQVQRYMEMYRFPEKFTRVNGEIQAEPYNPSERKKER